MLRQVLKQGLRYVPATHVHDHVRGYVPKQVLEGHMVRLTQGEHL